jgi:hypothetical protein
VKIISINNRDIIRRIAFRNEYDLLANKATEDIFNVIKGNYLNKSNIKQTFEYEDTKYIIDLTISYANLNNIKFDMGANFNPIDKESQTPPHIVMNIVLDYNFCEEDFGRICYRIYEFIRHEYEHFYECDKNIESSEEYKDNLKLMRQENLSDLERAKLVEKYMLDPYEIDAYARSIYYAAKKKKKRFQNVLWESMDVAFFGFNPNEQVEGHKNQQIMRIQRNIIDKITERIHKIFQITTACMLSTRGMKSFGKKW